MTSFFGIWRSIVARQPKKDEQLKDLWPGQSVELLKALHILTRDGALNADSRRKLKQVLHLVQLLRPPLNRLFDTQEAPRLADLGAGKSYLGFILYDLIFAPKGKGEVIAVETRGPLMEGAERLARDAKFDRMRFVAGTIAETNLDGEIDMVTALHACDTATDDAIRFALRHKARVVALVPCCQAELARSLEHEAKHPLHQLWRHPIQRREFASNLTNVIRALYLEANGYKVRVTELVGLEHSLKNELILAERHQLSNAQAKAELLALLKQLPKHPALVEGL
jgi:SAM-dependent methyltransferase